ncbi:MAG: hypothetical protein LBJ08_08735 [Bifidobacteriaceae bacterium]|jgi:tetratricopeptide (TPR) repeat protein|nr:hypothetical protein [Bifidobacteriaceae bacterium]
MVSSHHLAKEDIPAIPPEVTGEELDRDALRALGGLERDYADRIARHLVMCARLLDTDPELAYRHARTAADRAGRVGVVRESAGIAAYATGRYAEAARELRTYQRLSGTRDYLPVIADCERGLGRPERAVDIATSAEAKALQGDDAVEMAIVLAGARGDLGQHAAALAVLSRAARLPHSDAASQRLSLARDRVEALAAGMDPEEADWMEEPEDREAALDASPPDDATLFDAEEGSWCGRQELGGSGLVRGNPALKGVSVP